MGGTGGVDATRTRGEFRGHSTKHRVRGAKGGSATRELEPHVQRDERDGNRSAEQSKEAPTDGAGEHGHAHRLRVAESPPVASRDSRDVVRNGEVERKGDRTDEGPAQEPEPAFLDRSS